MDLERLLKEMTVFEKAMQCTQLITCFYRGVKLENNTANAIGPYTKLGLKQSDIYHSASSDCAHYLFNMSSWFGGQTVNLYIDSITWGVNEA